MSTVKTATGTSLAERIQDAIDRDLIQPPSLPQLTVQLQAMLQDDVRTDARQVAELIAMEPAITALLLRMANSASFGGLREITDLNQAIARLGLKAVAGVVTAAQLKGEFHGDSRVREKMLQTMWDHAIASAIVARNLAERNGQHRDEAFLAGLLHDCGSLVVLRGVDHLEAEAGEPGSITDAVLFDLIDAMNAQLGHHTLNLWNLPERICQATLHLDDPPPTENAGYIVIVQAANAVTRKLGFDLRPDTEMELLEDPAIDALQLSDLELATLMVDLEDEIEEIRGLL